MNAVSPVEALVTDHLDLWTAALKRKSAAGRGSSSKIELYGIRKLRELILELAVRGLLVPQDPNDEPASELLKKIAAEKAQQMKEGRIKKGKPLPSISGGSQHLPSGWSWTCMAALGEIAPRNEVKDDVIASFVPMPLISTRFDGRHDHESTTWAEIKKGYTHFADGDVAIAKITPCFENSKAAIFSGLHNGIGAGTTELHVVRPMGEFVSRSYLLLYLKSPPFLRVGETKMTGSAGQKRVPTEFFSFNPLPLPPLAEQHRIVAKVDELMALCDQLEQQTEASLGAHQTLVETLLSTLTSAADHAQFASAWQRIAGHFDTLFTTEESIAQLKQTILQLAVMGKLVPQDPNDEPASGLLKRLFAARDSWLMVCKEQNPECTTMLRKLKMLGVPKAPFPLPETWGCAHLIQVSLLLVDCHNKTAPYSAQGIPIIRTSNVRERRFRMEDVKFVSLDTYNYWSRRCPPAPGDIIFTREAPMGEAAIIPQEAQYCLGQRTMLIRPMHDHISAEYLLLALTEPHLLERASEYAIGSTVKHLRVGDVENLNIPIPPLAEQHRIVAKVDELMALCDQLKSRLSDAQTTQLHLADALVEQAIG